MFLKYNQHQLAARTSYSRTSQSSVKPEILVGHLWLLWRQRLWIREVPQPPRLIQMQREYIRLTRIYVAANDIKCASLLFSFCSKEDLLGKVQGVHRRGLDYGQKARVCLSSFFY
jgi:hypothetical protein